MLDTNPVELALASLDCTQSELARRLGLSRNAVSLWKLRGKVPVEHVLLLSKVSGVPCHILSPKFFPKPVEVTRAAHPAEEA